MPSRPVPGSWQSPRRALRGPRTVANTGYGKVVEILLGRDDVNPDKPDMYDRTPLLCAAENEHEEVVEILDRKSVV